MWSATLQLAVLVTTVVLGVGCIPLMYLSAHWYLGSSLFSPLKTPLGGLSTQVCWDEEVEGGNTADWACEVEACMACGAGGERAGREKEQPVLAGAGAGPAWVIQHAMLWQHDCDAGPMDGSTPDLQ